MITHISKMKSQSWHLCSPEGEVEVVDLYIWHDAMRGNTTRLWMLLLQVTLYDIVVVMVVRYVLYKLSLWTFVHRNWETLSVTARPPMSSSVFLHRSNCLPCPRSTAVKTKQFIEILQYLSIATVSYYTCFQSNLTPMLSKWWLNG